MPRLGQRHIQACRRKSRPLGIRADRRGARPSRSLTKRLETPCELSLGQARVEDDGELGDGGEGSDSTATQAGAVVAVGSGDAAQGVFRHRRRGNPGEGSPSRQGRRHEMQRHDAAEQSLHFYVRGWKSFETF